MTPSSRDGLAALALATVACSPYARDAGEDTHLPDASALPTSDAGSGLDATASGEDAGGGDAGADLDAGRSYASVVGADLPTGYWRMAFAGGSIPNELPSGPPLVVDTSGVIVATDGALTEEDGNVAVLLDGTASLHTVDPGAYEPNIPSTVECWARPESAIEAVVVGKFAYGIAVNGYALTANAEMPLFHYGNGTSAVQVSAASAVATGWHHLVAVVSPGATTLYVDGEQVATVTSTLTPMSTASIPLGVGGGGQSGQTAYARFRGAIDEVALYGSALTADRVKAHFDAARR